MASISKSLTSVLLGAAASVTLVGAAFAQSEIVHLPSTVPNIIRGEFNNTRSPVLRIQSGQTVKIDTVSHGGTVADPVAFFAPAGIGPSEILKDVMDIGAATAANGWGGHVLTGPIYIEGAEPGDMLEVKIISVEPRVPYGVNNPGPGGVAPTLVPTRLNKIIKFDMEKRTANIVPGVNIPLKPFLGIMATAPSPEAGGRSASGPPGPSGGNMDLSRLVAGSTLYLPVFNDGALFYTGDPHAAQGDGEVSGNALEASMTAVLQFTLRKGYGQNLKWPMAEDADNYYVMGMHADLAVALRATVEQTVAFLQREAGMSVSDAYSLSSTGIDFSIAHGVNANRTVYSVVPKSFFDKPLGSWKN